MELHSLIKSFVGKVISVDIDETDTVGDLDKAIDIILAIDPTIIIEETIVYGDSGPLDKNATLSSLSIKEGDTLQYSYVLNG